MLFYKETFGVIKNFFRRFYLSSEQDSDVGGQYYWYEVTYYKTTERKIIILFHFLQCFAGCVYAKLGMVSKPVRIFLLLLSDHISKLHVNFLIQKQTSIIQGTDLQVSLKLRTNITPPENSGSWCI